MVGHDLISHAGNLNQIQLGSNGPQDTHEGCRESHRDNAQFPLLFQLHHFMKFERILRAGDKSLTVGLVLRRSKQWRTWNFHVLVHISHGNSGTRISLDLSVFHQLEMSRTYSHLTQVVSSWCERSRMRPALTNRARLWKNFCPLIIVHVRPMLSGTLEIQHLFWTQADDRRRSTTSKKRISQTALMALWQFAVSHPYMGTRGARTCCPGGITSHCIEHILLFPVKEIGPALARRKYRAKNKRAQMLFENSAPDSMPALLLSY